MLKNYKNFESAIRSQHGDLSALGQYDTRSTQHVPPIEHFPETDQSADYEEDSYGNENDNDNLGNDDDDGSCYYETVQ